MGEPAGVGTEILLKAYKHFSDLPPGGGPTFFLIDDPFRIEKIARAFSADISIATISDPAATEDHFYSDLPILPLETDLLETLKEVRPGHPSAATAPAVIGSIEKAVQLVKNQEAAALVTLPIQKEALRDGGFKFPGHTEFIGELTKDIDMPTGAVRSATMMLTAGPFRVVPATVHIPLRDVADAITPDLITKIALVTAQGLVRDYGIDDPRLAVVGLNPHAGENGHIGREEVEIIAPTVQRLRDKGLNIVGPIPGDTMFHEEARAQYDAAIAMYHDQALLPIKTIAFHAALNTTLGLPIVRTSPDHGTALGLVGKGIARPDSLINAIYAAQRAASARQRFDDLQQSQA